MPFPLDAIIINDELQRRPSRPPDFAAESKALVRLARSMAETPQHVLSELAEAALRLCGAGSAGISLAEIENGNDIFRWQATAGAFASLIGSTMPRDFSPCGTVVDRNASQLMANPARYYDYIATMNLPVLELLLVPFDRDGVAIGTIWAVSHTKAKQFDAEDHRLLTSLGEFASAALQVLSSLEEAKRTQTELIRLREEEKTAYFRDATDRKRAEEALRASEEQRRLALDSADLGSWHVIPATMQLMTDERFRAIFGSTLEALDYEHAVARIHPDDQARVRAAVAAATRPEHPEPYAVEYRVVQPDGSVRWVFAKGRANFRGNGSERRLVTFDGTVADVSERKQSEEATRRRAFQLQKLADIANRINTAHDVNSVVGVVTEEARNLVATHQAATSMVLDPGHPPPINVVSVSEKYRNESTPPCIDGLKFYQVVSKTNEPIRLTQAELDADPRWKASRSCVRVGPTLNGWLAAPLMGRSGKRMGLIQLSDKCEGGFTDDDEAILVQLAQLTAIAIENARLYQELRANDERKNEFLAMLAHELRNPLAAISNAVNVSVRSGSKEHVDWSMDVITRQMQHLSRLIDDLMDVSRITSGKIQLRRAVLDATPILESAAATVKTLANERKHTLDLSIEPGNLWVNVDPTRFEQVVVNLLNNAAKYSENAGHILLSARNEANKVIISVKDRGVGIPPEKLPEMFELFAQGDRSLARSEGGLGIGLTVVKKLVEMHGGTITARSEGIGKGSEFVIQFPAVQAPSRIEPRANDTTVKESRKARILVVDDNVDTARGMARLLKLVGHEVKTAHSGPESIEVAKEYQPDFVLLDIGLPGMSGYEVASKLRHEECCKDAVIVAVSGYGQDEDRRRSKDAGFDHHLTKPLDYDALTTLLSVGSSGRP